eukprot:scaffold3165_cov29-Tisochrysis_lutea.AAC.3
MGFEFERSNIARHGRLTRERIRPSGAQLVPQRVVSWTELERRLRKASNTITLASPRKSSGGTTSLVRHGLICIGDRERTSKEAMAAG